MYITKTMDKRHISKYQQENGSNFLFYGLLAYTVIFYAQIGSRFPVLAPFRPELTIGSILLIVILIKTLKGEIYVRENMINSKSH